MLLQEGPHKGPSLLGSLLLLRDMVMWFTVLGPSYPVPESHYFDGSSVYLLRVTNLFCQEFAPPSCQDVKEIHANCDSVPHCSQVRY